MANLSHDNSPRRYLSDDSDLNDIEYERLLVLFLVQRESSKRKTGFYTLRKLGEDRAIVRWIEGPCEESVCLIDFTRRHVLFLNGMRDSHSSLAESLKLPNWEIHCVDAFIEPVCPNCNGVGAIYKSFDFYSSTISGVLTCDICGGEGVWK